MAVEIEKASEWADQGLVFIGQAESMEIRDQASLDEATTFLTGVRALQREIHEFMDPMVQSAHEHHKLLVERRSTLLDGPATAERVIKDKLVAHERAQREEREAAEKRQREDIRRQQEQRQLELAAEAEKAGDKARAERILAGPPPAVLVPPVRPAVPPTKATGVTFREVWKAEVTDLGALVLAVAMGSVPQDYLLPNQAALDGLARALKDGLRIPGVEARKEMVAAGSKR